MLHNINKEKERQRSRSFPFEITAAQYLVVLRWVYTKIWKESLPRFVFLTKTDGEYKTFLDVSMKTDKNKRKHLTSQDGQCILVTSFFAPKIKAFRAGGTAGFYSLYYRE